MVVRIMLVLTLCGAWVISPACAATRPPASVAIGGPVKKNPGAIGGAGKNVAGFKAAPIQRRH